MNRNCLLILLGIIVIISSCKQKLSIVEYKKWLENPENGLIKVKQEGSLNLEVQLKPIEFLAAVESKGNQEKFAKIIKEDSGYVYIDLLLQNKDNKLSEAGAKSESDIYNKLYYLNFGFQNDIKLEEGNINYPCSIYHFERSYEIANKNKFLLGFKLPESNREKTLIIDCYRLGGGIIKFKFQQKDLEELPQIKL